MPQCPLPRKTQRIIILLQEVLVHSLFRLQPIPENAQIPARFIGVHKGHENMFAFKGDSDIKDDESATFPNRTLMMQHEFAQPPMEDPNMGVGPGGGLQWDASLPGQFNTQIARYSGGKPGQLVTIGSYDRRHQIFTSGMGCFRRVPWPNTHIDALRF
ncbi:hypothetical protein DL95DRAFT_412428 [Leptodontidium sp. 2 PMI_412]|nr:hypothetical protein DL95DRAFT_412428 [Leptodontidium sp. 2 PMI_412]